MTMHSPALALGWQLWRQHHRLLYVVLAWLVGILALGRLLHLLHLDVRYEWMILGWVAIVPATIVYAYALVVFTYGLEMDVVARASGFPVAMFTLPLRTATLVFWPMVFGTAA